MYFWMVKEREKESMRRNHLDKHIAGRFFEVVFALSTFIFRFWVVFMHSGLLPWASFHKNYR